MLHQLFGAPSDAGVVAEPPQTAADDAQSVLAQSQVADAQDLGLHVMRGSTGQSSCGKESASRGAIRNAWDLRHPCAATQKTDVLDEGHVGQVCETDMFAGHGLLPKFGKQTTCWSDVACSGRMQRMSKPSKEVTAPSPQVGKCSLRHACASLVSYDVATPPGRGRACCEAP